MNVTEAAVAFTCLLSILFFGLYVLALTWLPTGERPKTPTMDRFGGPLPPSENPGYQETEEEHH